MLGDVVFAAGRVIEEGLELHFKAWDLDDFSDKTIIPFHVKLSIEGIPQHVWSSEIADKVLCDETIVHHVEEATRRGADHRAFHCWVFSKDPSCIPQVVFLTLTEFEAEQHNNHLHFVRPRGMQHAHVTKVLIHIDVVEDLAFYHYPCEDLVADGKVPWRDFTWHSRRPDGEIEEDKVNPPTRFCSFFADPRWSRHGDDNDHKRHMQRGFMHQVSSWWDGCGRSRAGQLDGDRGCRWFRGESSRRRADLMDSSPVSSWESSPRDEQRALHSLWQDKGKVVSGLAPGERVITP
jgi:hypothetical protein